MTQGPQWIVGVDLRKRSDGAIRYAHWLRTRMDAGHDAQSVGDDAQRDGVLRPTLIGLHILERSQLRSLRKHGTPEEIRARIEGAAQRVVEGAGAADAVDRIEVHESKRADIGIADARAEYTASTIVIGRKSGAHEGAIVRLGSVARRVLRALPCPVVVVPPDLDTASFGEGPIVLAAVPGDSSVGALKFSAALARAIGRELVCVHIVRLPLDYAQLYWSDEDVAHVREEQAEGARRAMREWLDQHGGSDARLVLRSGLEFDEISGACAELKAALLVTGSRRLSGIERVALMSVSSDLAAHASLPVAVVPPEHRG